MLPKDLPQDIEILIIVITRSESPNLRKLFRHIYGNAYNTDVNSFNLTFKYKLIFLFAIDDLATFMEEKKYYHWKWKTPRYDHSHDWRFIQNSFDEITFQLLLGINAKNIQIEMDCKNRWWCLIKCTKVRWTYENHTT